MVSGPSRSRGCGGARSLHEAEKRQEVRWSPQPLPEPGSMKEGARLLYLFATGFPMELLALLLLASNGVVYEYYNPEPHLWGIAPLPDQQVGGLIMGGLGQLAAFVAITLLFFRYLDQEDARERQVRPPIDAA